MKNQSIINDLEDRISSIVSIFGEDACFAYADKVYSQSFRSEPFRICDMLNERDLNQEQYYSKFNEIVDELWDEISSEMYTLATGFEIPSADVICNDEYCELLSWVDSRDDWLSKKGLFASNFIHETTEIVTLCNYKGELEGRALVYNDQVKKLPVFVSKRESFNI